MLALALLVSGCGTIASERTVGKPCPPLAQYSAAEQSQAAAEQYLAQGRTHFDQAVADWQAAGGAPTPPGDPNV